MSKQVSAPVPAMAPITGVQDPAVRRAIQGLIDAHNTRNGQTRERFLTEADIDQLAGRIVFSGLSGWGAGGPGGGGGEGGWWDGIQKSIEDRIFRTELWKKLSSEIEWLNEQTSLSVARIKALGDGFITERIERREGDSALLQQFDSMKVAVGNNMAAILEEKTVRATHNTALVQAINTMWASVGVNNALTQDGGDIAVNWNAAQATRWEQLQVEVFGANGVPIRAALKQESDLRVDLAGKINATWTVRMAAGGRWAGFGLGMEGQGGSVVSTFIIAADQFAIVNPGAQNSAPHIPFYVGPTGGLVSNASTTWANVFGAGKPENGATVGARIGTNLTKATGGVAVSADFLATWNKLSSANIAAFMETAAIGTAYIGDAAIVNAKIGTAAVDTLKIAGNAVTVPVSAALSGVVSGNNAYQQVASLVVQNTHSSSIPVLLYFFARQGYSSGSRQTGLIVKQNGSTISNAGFASLTNDYLAWSVASQISANSSSTFSIEWFGQDSTVTINQRTLTCLGLKK